MLVKICHQPCSSSRKLQGMPMLRLVAVRETQKRLSIFHRRNPALKNTVYISNKNGGKNRS